MVVYLSAKNIRFESVEVGRDIDLWPDPTAGWDSGLHHLAKKMIEIKFTSGNRVHLSKRQASMAVEQENAYFILVIYDRDGLRKELLSLSAFDFETYFDYVIDHSYLIEDIHRSLILSPNPEEIEPDIHGYWIKEKMWLQGDGKNFKEWLHDLN